jgi:DNA-binding MarR family transcriptional regulator
MSLNEKQIAILRAIDSGKTSQNEIAASLNLENYLVAYYLDELQNSGYIQACKHPTGRAGGEKTYSHCKLTPKGKVSLQNPEYLIENANLRIIDTGGGAYNEVTVCDQSHVGIASDFQISGDSRVDIGSRINENYGS